MNRAVPNPDFATRLGQQLHALRVQFGHQHLLDAFRRANASLDPREVSAWLVAQAASWVPTANWAVVAPDTDASPTLLARHGEAPEADVPMWAAGAWVLAHGEPLFSPDVASDDRVDGSTGTALALPLVARGRTVGALVGFDPSPSGDAPGLVEQLSWVGDILEPSATALDNALIVGRAEALSVTDDLTGLFNVRFLNMVLQRETKRAFRSATPLSLLFIDLDNFKSVNDRFGHMAGSQALVETAEVLRGCARETDVVARFGGDEFAMLLPDTGLAGGMAVAARVRTRLGERVFLTSAGLAVHVTASIGVAALPDRARSAEELLRAADMAMYRVKGTGKDGILVAEEL